MPDNEVKVIFTAEDQISSKADKAAASVTSFADGLSNAFSVSGGIVAGIVAGALVIGKAFDDIVKAAEKNPEFFTEKDLANIQEYSEAVQELNASWQSAKASTLSPLMAELADHVLQVRDASLVYDAYGHAVEDNLGSAARSYIAMAEAAEEAQDRMEIANKKTLSMMERLAGASEEATQKIIYNNLLAKLSVDGITEAEFALATEAGIALGIFDEKTAGLAESINRFTDDVISGRQEIDNFRNAINGLPSYKQIVIETIVQSTIAGALPGFGRTQRVSPGGIDMNWVAQETNRINSQ